MHARRVFLVMAATAIALLPFIGKAVHIDDPLFVWAAQHITAHPLDPYGFDVNWYGEAARMADVTKNPPLVSYYLSLAGRTFGWSDVALHIAMLLPAMLVAAGAYLLAARFTARPLLATALALATPGFLVSATTLMGDVPMLAAWVFAVWFWVRGLDRGNHIDLAVGMLLVAVATLTKYYGLALFPLLLFYAWLRPVRPARWWIHAALPLIVLVGYHIMTASLYGRSLLFDAFGYATDADPTSTRISLASVPVGLSFVGGCVASVVFMAPWLWDRTRLLIGAGAIVGLTTILAMSDTLRSFTMPADAAARWSIAAQVALWAVAGAGIFALAIRDWRERRDADAVLLFLWIAGTFVFAAFVNWTVNARSVLPIVVPAGILMARWLDTKAAMENPSRVWISVGLSAALALTVASADFAFAGASRDLADRVRQQYGARTVWFQGHWGFQYYMERGGARAIDARRSKVTASDLVVVPEPNTNILGVPPDLVTLIDTIEGPAALGIATVSPRRGAMFYGDLPLPFAVAPGERQSVRVFEMKPR